MYEFIDQDDPQMEEDLNRQEGSNSELCDDGVAQVKDSEESTPTVSVVPASCSAINEATKKTNVSSLSSRNGESLETGEINTVAGEDNRNDGDDGYETSKSDEETSSLVTQPQNPHRSYSDTSLLMISPRENVGFSSLVTRPSHQNPRLDQIVSFVPASCSAINEATKKTEASSSRNCDSSESGEIRRVDDKEEDRNDVDEPKESDNKESDIYKKTLLDLDNLDGFFEFSVHNEEAENREIQSHEETCGLITHPLHQNPRLDQIARSGQTMNPQQQFTRTNRGSTSSTSDRNYFRQPPSMQRQFFPSSPAWNTYQQHPVANPMANPMMPMHGPMMYPYQHLVANQQNFYQQHPVTNQIPNVVPFQTQMFNLGPASAPRRLQNTYPVVYQMPTGIQTFIPWHVLQQLSGMRPMPYPRGNQQNFYQQHPMAHHMPMPYSMANQQNFYYQRPVTNLVPAQSTMIMPAESHVHWYDTEQCLNSWGMRLIQDPVMYPCQYPHANHLNQRMPQFRSNQLSTTRTPDGQTRSVAIVQDPFNPQQRVYLVLDVVPQAQVNHLLQPQTQTQQPTQSQGGDGEASSSEQGGYQQQPK
ncbi:hypothetical protein ISN44_As11g037120 [Arabidopsis suecica]|uniref:Uncharacterized protein n=1 Tax=Arabidopsis suecica TaxID=45249 RepID=A0A8T1ZHI8_ARASU|nr:hypothetical protein ISN44_As11g037120 [Arabidopsis suecica]